MELDAVDVFADNERERQLAEQQFERTRAKSNGDRCRNCDSWRRLSRTVLVWCNVLLALSLPVNVWTQQSLDLCDPVKLYKYPEYSNGTFGTREPPARSPYGFTQAADCLFQFRAGSGKVVWIEWITFHLEEPLISNNQCLNDYVEIIITDYQKQQHVSRRYCGTDTPPKLETMQRMVDIRFHASATNHYAGISGTFKFIDESEVPAPSSKFSNLLPVDLKDQCGGLARGKYSGEITSPGYPDAYPGDIECNWLIRVHRGKQIYVKLVDLQLTEGMLCEQAAIFIIDGYKHSSLLSPTKRVKNTDDNSQVRFCGDDQYYQDEGLKSYMSDQNRMIVKFVAKDPPAGRIAQNRQNNVPIGFRLIWTEVTIMEGDVRQCDGFLCSGGEYCIDEGKTVCATRKRYCVDKSLMCDGRPNCAEKDDSDEENCYALQIVFAGVLVLLLLIVVILTVVCCQKRRNTFQLQVMKQQRGVQMTSQQRAPRPDSNALSNSYTRAATNSNREMEQNELRAMAQNYHGTSTPIVSNQQHQYSRAIHQHAIPDDQQQHSDTDEAEALARPFLNHVAPPQARPAPVAVPRTPEYQLVHAVPAQAVWQECHCPEPTVAIHRHSANVAMEATMGDDLRLTASCYDQSYTDEQATPLPLYRAQPAVIRDASGNIIDHGRAALTKKKSVGFKE